MARMHSRNKGKSRSTKPAEKKTPGWVQYKPKEIEMVIVKYAKEGLKPSQIGTLLRDEYGIPEVQTVCGKKITEILEEKKMSAEVPEDLMALIRKAVLVRKHMEDNKQDMTAKRGLQLTESKIKRLVKYYKGKGKLSLEWKYDPKRIRLLVE
jgi:small subunit ribosomal protein S15